MTNPQTPNQLYNSAYFDKADGIISWRSQSLKFGDAMAGLCYALGITWFELVEQYKKVFEHDANGRGESVSDRYIDNQLCFLQEKHHRWPKRVLEIGGGRGEVATALKALGIDVVSVEVSKDAAALYAETARHYFGAQFEPVVPVNKPIQDLLKELDFSTFDTILMVESLEHIPEQEFQPVWDKIANHFTGRFITVNWPDYHPIWIGRDASPEEHCRVVDDALYNQWSKQAKNVITRWGSHLVLEF